MSFIKKILLTFYSRSFYVELIRRGKGIGIGFMLFQLLMELLIPAVSLAVMTPTLKQKTQEVFAQLPNITIADYKLSIDRPSPYSVNVLNDNKAPSTMMFDMSIASMSVEEIENKINKEKLIALVTPDFFAIRKNKAVEIRSFQSYGNSLKNAKINHEQWILFGQQLITWFLPLVFVFIFVFLFIFQLILNFFAGLIIGFLTSLTPIKMGLTAAIRLSAAASIPGGILNFLLAVFSLLTHHQPAYNLSLFVLAIIWTVIVIIAVETVRRDEQAPTL